MLSSDLIKIIFQSLRNYGNLSNENVKNLAIIEI